MPIVSAVSALVATNAQRVAAMWRVGVVSLLLSCTQPIGQAVYDTPLTTPQVPTLHRLWPENPENTATASASLRERLHNNPTHSTQTLIPSSQNASVSLLFPREQKCYEPVTVLRGMTARAFAEVYGEPDVSRYEGDNILVQQFSHPDYAVVAYLFQTFSNKAAGEPSAKGEFRARHVEVIYAAGVEPSACFALPETK